MIDLLSNARGLLQEAGYSVRFVSFGSDTVACFEDGSIIGFCRTVEDPDELIQKWKTLEKELLIRFSQDIRQAGDKAWNVYCVFLCPSSANKDQKRAVSWIEEDLNRTRKLAECDIASREDLVHVLLPILLLQAQPMLEYTDLTERLRHRIANITPQAANVALDPTISVSEVVRLLGERP